MEVVEFSKALKMDHADFVDQIYEDRFYTLKHFKGECVVLGCDLHMYSRFWNMYRKHPEIPFNDHFFIDYNDVFTDRLMRKIFFAMIKPTIDMLDIDKHVIWRTGYQIYNEIYNYAVENLIPFMDSIDEFAIMELLNDPRLRESNQRVQDRDVDVEYGYETLKEVLSDPIHETNPVVRARRYNTVPVPQLNQSLVAIGQVTDIDSVVFLNEVLRGFAMGYTDVNSLAKTSRSAAKALLFNKAPVADAEYFNRKLQLVGNYIESIVQHHDCGTTDYHTIAIPENKAIFELFEGITMVLPEGGIRPIETSDTDLMGKRIRIRTTMCCRELKHQRVCSTCYGRLSYGVANRLRPDAPTALPEELELTGNPGHISTTALCGPATQKVISTKHLDFIRCVILIVLAMEDRRYMEIHRTLDSIKFRSGLANKNLKIRVDAEEARNLISLVYINNLDNPQLGYFTSISYAEIITHDKDGFPVEAHQTNLARQATNASLSAPMLRYIKKHGWERAGKQIVIDLKEWNFDEPVFTYQLKHENMAAYVDRVELFVRSTSNDSSGKGSPRAHMQRLTRFEDPTEALMAAIMLMAEKLSVNVAHIATILAASRVKDPDNGDWSIANGLSEGKFCAHDDIIYNRDLGAAMLFEEQTRIFTSPRSYKNKSRVRSPLKPLIKP